MELDKMGVFRRLFRGRRNVKKALVFRLDKAVSTIIE